MTNPWTEESKAKPPLGLVSEEIHNQRRCIELLNAMLRYAHKGIKIPSEWLNEYYRINKRIAVKVKKKKRLIDE